MVDLGRYAAEVLLAYGGTLVLLIGIVWASVARARRVARALGQAEADRDGR